MKFPTFLVLWVMLLSCLPAAAQVDCQPILELVERAYNQGRGNLDSALIYLQDAERCDYANTLLADRQRWQKEIFQSIQALKQQALAT
ncbi:MAG: hypothetical protein NWR72_04535, partial [Bacteroidia bacterium]|nr:hypothetical protein [Bacteroidia bacterium]